MKICTFISLAFVFFFLVSCSEEQPTRLIMEIGTPPQGGTNVTQVRVGVVGHLEDGDTPIESQLEWMWKENSTTEPIVYWEESITWDNQDPEEIWAGVQAPSGYVLVGRFWFRGTWYDEDSTYHEIYSDTVMCKI